MKTISTILCATDFGACAQAALMQSLRIANAHGARVDLLHVANVPHYVRRDMVGVLGPSGARPLSEIAVEECAREMEVTVEGLPEQDRQRVTTHCKFGAPVATILQFAEAHRADLIVIGSSGKTRVTKYILGGTAGKVVRGATCPVLCVPNDEARATRKVLVASDFSDCARRALEAGAFMAQAAHAHLEVAHVTPSAWSLPPGVNVGFTGQTANWLELLEREAREQLDEFVDKARIDGIKVDSRALLVGSPAQSLLSHARDHEFDLLVLGTHGRSGVARLMLGSVAETVVHHAPAPVLTVRG